MTRPETPPPVAAGAFRAPLSVVLVLAVCAAAAGQRTGRDGIELSTMFTNNMVLQRDTRVPVWGMTQPGRTVAVSFADQSKTAVAAQDGAWILHLDALPASSEPRALVVDYVPGTEDPIVRDNVLVGDVWFCSGQSNMELGIGAIQDRANELRDTKYAQIRLYPIAKTASPFAARQIVSIWRVADRQNLVEGGWNGFSAVAYTFGRMLHKELGVPIGLIQSAYGGSSIDPWIPPEEMRGNAELARDLALIQRADQQYLQARKTDPNARHPWEGITDYSQLKPAMLYNAMVAPVAPFAIKGVIWYQGETNVGEGMRYAEKVKQLIAGWRRVFGSPELPFYYVQLPPWQYGTEGALPAFWEVQVSSLTIPHTGMAVTVDVGDPGNIHPANKRPVGERLALLALTDTYGRADLESSGPVFRGLRVENGQAVVSFDHAQGGLVTTGGGSPSWFTIAGADMVFVPAEAGIQGDTVIVRSERVPQPVAVRYAWSNVAAPNLYNAAGLPARPFRTDK